MLMLTAFQHQLNYIQQCKFTIICILSLILTNSFGEEPLFLTFIRILSFGSDESFLTVKDIYDRFA